MLILHGCGAKEEAAKRQPPGRRDKENVAGASPAHDLAIAARGEASRPGAFAARGEASRPEKQVRLYKRALPGFQRFIKTSFKRKQVYLENR